MGVTPTQRSTPWLWIVLIWAGVGLFDATQTIFVMRAEGMHHAWIRLKAVGGMVAMGVGDSVRADAGPAISSSESVANLHLDFSRCRLRRDRPGACRLDCGIGHAAKSMGRSKPFSTVHSVLVGQVL